MLALAFGPHFFLRGRVLGSLLFSHRHAFGAAVEAPVFGPVHELQVFRSVIRSIVVYLMHVLMAFQRAVKRLLHDQPMFSLVTIAAEVEEDIAIGSESTRPPLHSTGIVTGYEALRVSLDRTRVPRSPRRYSCWLAAPAFTKTIALVVPPGDDPPRLLAGTFSRGYVARELLRSLVSVVRLPRDGLAATALTQARGSVAAQIERRPVPKQVLRWDFGPAVTSA